MSPPYDPAELGIRGRLGCLEDEAQGRTPDELFEELKDLNSVARRKFDARMKSAEFANPSTQAGFLMFKYGNPVMPGMELNQLVRDLEAATERDAKGMTADAAKMLFSQANALSAIFTNLANRSVDRELIAHLELYLRLGLKAQSQCRATLETLAAVLNPPVVFAKQANFANQQVNQVNQVSGPAAVGLTHATKAVSAPNELLGLTHEAGTRLDLGTPTGAVTESAGVAPVESVHRTKDSGRQGAVGTKRLQRR